MPAKFNQSHKEILDSILLSSPEVSPGKMFGYPAYYIGGKLAICLYEDAVGVKVPEKLAKELLVKKHITTFQPMGKPKMREWVQLNREKSTDYVKDKNILFASIDFVATLSKK